VQCLAMIPGTSRSGATIIGGMLLGLSRKAATDFSFYLAIPTLVGAGAYSLYKERALLSMADVPLFGVGLVVSFLSAWVCVRWLLRFIATPQLCRLCLLPHCVWHRGAGHPHARSAQGGAVRLP
jgi:undecaprenyl-diphosphatase